MVKRFVIRFFVVFGLVFSFTSAFAPASEAEEVLQCLYNQTECESVANEYEGKSPPTLAEFMTMTESRQKLVFIYLSNVDKAEFWRISLTNYIEENIGVLTDKQKNYLFQLLSIITPDLYALSSADRESLASKIYYEGLKVLPTDELAKAAMHPCSACTGGSLNSLAGPSTLTAKPACNCSVSAQGCQMPYFYFTCYRDDCQSSSMGCSILWLAKCSGTCKRNGYMNPDAWKDVDWRLPDTGK